MRLVEFDTSKANTEKLAALGQFFLSRANDTNATKTMPISTFLSLSKDMGVSLTLDQLQNLAQQPPLNEIISSIEGDADTGKIIFKGAEEVAPNMSVDQARDTVDTMAKRAASKPGL